MARPMQQTINCPRCGQPFGAILEQIIDAGLDPTAKERLVSGRVNLVSCPHCGYQGMVSTPLMYHDPEKKMAIVHMPMELNLSTEERERLIGEMTQVVMHNLPEDAPRGYLLQPGTALTVQGLVEQVLEAEGITREMLDAERRKIELIDQLTQAPSGEVDNLIEENQDLVDMTFLQLLTAAAESFSQNGQNRQSLRLLNVRSKLMETTEAGRELQAQEEAVMEATRELQGLGEQPTREQFVDLLVNAAGNPAKREALAMMGRNLLDYQTFELFSERVDQADGEQKEQLTQARERMLEIAAEYERQSQAMVQQAVGTLRTLLSANDVEAAVEQNLDRIDQTFLAVLQANLEEARRTGQVEVSSKLKRIRDKVLSLVQQSTPPEVLLINDLLGAETDDQARELLRERRDMLSPDLVAVLGEVAEQLREMGRDAEAQRLVMLQAEAETLV